MRKKKGGKILKTFFGGTFINQEDLKEEGKEYPIKIEYYKNINEDELIKTNKTKYGIYVVKTEYIPENTKTEDKEIKYLTNDEQKIEKILEFFKRNEVTPIIVDDVVEDLKKQLF